MTPLDAEIVKRFNAAVDIECQKAEEMMISGLQNHVVYREQHARRKAMLDAKGLLEEVFNTLMKE